MNTKYRLPMELHKNRFIFFVYQPEGMDAKSFHHSVASRNCTVTHHPHNHVCGLGGLPDEIPEGIVRRSRLWYLVMRLRFYGMNKVRKLNSVLDKKHRYVIAYEIKVSFFGIKFNCEPSYVTGKICRPSRTCYR